MNLDSSTMLDRPSERPAEQIEHPSATETIHLTPESCLIPPSLLVPPSTDERHHILRDEAAVLLNRHLRRLARMRNPIELRISQLLGRMKRLSSYFGLGFAGMTDYAVERLGLSARRTQVLMQIDDGLRHLPATASAYEAGRLSHSQVLLLLRIATPATESAWIGKATTMNVRKLEKEVRRARAASASASTPTPTPTNGSDDESHLDEQLVQVSFQAPDWLRGEWDWAVEVFRRTAGAAAPIWQAAEGFAAEYLSGLPQLPPELTGMSDDVPATDAPHCVDPMPGSPDCDESESTEPQTTEPLSSAENSVAEGEGIALFEELQHALEDEIGISQYVPSPDDIEVTLPPDLEAPDAEAEIPVDAVILDHRLRGLIELRQNLAWHQGRLLRTFANYHLYRALGFESLSRYCRENLGMSVRRARRLIALERRLIELPQLERAYRKGVLSWVKASEIARVARSDTEQAWIHLGRSITARRLRDEVALALADIENEALPWDASRGFPRGLTSDGRVQLSAPTIQPPPDPGVQTSAHSNRITTRVRFHAPAEVAQLWRQALSACRAVNGDHLQEWECVAQFLQSFRQTWDLRGSAAWLRRYAVFERDGWRCRVPGCTSRRNLHAHHIVFRSQGGGDESDNLVSVCVTHHHHCLHTGSLRCRRLPDGLLAWEFGAASGGNDSGSGSSESLILRFVEDVVWEAAQDSVRTSADRSSAAGSDATRRGRSARTPA